VFAPSLWVKTAQFFIGWKVFKKSEWGADVFGLQIAEEDNVKMNDAGCMEAANRFKDSHTDKRKEERIV
jgi:hypothetical protein